MERIIKEVVKPVVEQEQKGEPTINSIEKLMGTAAATFISVMLAMAGALLSNIVLEKEYIYSTEASPLLLKSLMLQTLYAEVCLKKKRGIFSSPHFSMIQKVTKYIHDNISKKISLSELSAIANMNSGHFHKSFTKAMKVTPNEYMTTAKMNKAKELLIKTNLSMAEIEVQCGMENTPYFSYLLKKQLAVSPSKFRKDHRYF